MIIICRVSCQDWANHENSWHSKPVPYPDQADLVTQAQLVKRASRNRTKVFVYRKHPRLPLHFTA